MNSQAIPPRTRTVAIDRGIDLHVVEWIPAAGDDDDQVPFVLLHGLASNSRLWDGVGRRLAAAGHRAIAVDLRGHGRSSKPDIGYETPTVADDVAALLDELGLDRPIVAGQSWGGNVVLELAARHPAAVSGIALVDGGWIDLQRGFADWHACRARLAPPRLIGRPAAEFERQVRAWHGDWPETGIQGMLANFEVRADGTIAPWLTFERHMLVLRGLWEHRPAEQYPLVTAPTLLIPADTGDAERTADKRRDVKEASVTIQRARIRWFTSDHDIHAQFPAELGDVLTDATTDGFFGVDA